MKSVHRALVLSTMLLLFAVTTGRTDDQPAKSALEGRWKVVSAHSNGSTYAVSATKTMFVTVEKDEIRFNIEGTEAVQAAKFVLRPDRKPAEIDFRETKDHAWNGDNVVTKLFHGYKLTERGAIPDEDKKAEGIYKLEGDQLTLCWRTIKSQELGTDGKIAQESQVRPTIFQSHLYYHQFLFVLKRTK